MKKTFFIALVTLFASGFSVAQNPNFDNQLAKKLNADELGMKTYVLVILKTGTANITDKNVRDSLFRGHFANINKLVEEKKLVVAGPLDKNTNSYRGIFIFDVPNFDEVEQLLKGDPTINEKIFDVEMYRWYGSAALPEYLTSADKIWSKKP